MVALKPYIDFVAVDTLTEETKGLATYSECQIEQFNLCYVEYSILVMHAIEEYSDLAECQARSSARPCAVESR